MKRNELKIGLFGFGCVGYGLYEVLQRTQGLKAQIKTICVKNENKQRQLPDSHFVYDKDIILNDPEINVVVELIDDADAAFDIVSAALRNGKAVVSANKKMIAEHLSELIKLQQIYNVPLLYEAACCASLPIIRNLEEYYDNDLLESIEGIVNGSTNYILTKTIAENLSYEIALKQAQEKGFAESNPRLDVEGYDAKYKLLILIAHAYGIVVKPEDIFNLGIQNLGVLELKYAKEKGLKIKLVAHAYKNADGSVSGFVIPQFISNTHQLFHVDDVFNGIIAQSCFADKQFFVGKGAGAFPTASAVISDISALSYDYRYEYKKLNAVDRLRSDKAIYLKIFLRYDLAYSPEFTAYFEEINETYLNKDSGYIVGIISLSNLKTIHARKIAETSIVLVEVIQLETEQSLVTIEKEKRVLNGTLI